MGQLGQDRVSSVRRQLGCLVPGEARDAIGQQSTRGPNVTHLQLPAQGDFQGWAPFHTVAYAGIVLATASAPWGVPAASD